MVETRAIAIGNRPSSWQAVGHQDIGWVSAGSGEGTSQLLVEGVPFAVVLHTVVGPGAAAEADAEGSVVGGPWAARSLHIDGRRVHWRDAERARWAGAVHIQRSGSVPVGSEEGAASSFSPTVPTGAVADADLRSSTVPVLVAEEEKTAKSWFATVHRQRYG